MGDVTNVKLGVCSITFNSVDLGHTKGGVEITYSPEYYDKTVDQYGNTIYDKVLIGEKLMVKVPLAEYTHANLKVALPAGTEDATTDAVQIGKQAGLHLASSAAQLILHPIANAAGDRSEDVVLHKAVVTSEITIARKYDEEALIEVTFESLLDESKSDGNYLGLFGDSD